MKLYSVPSGQFTVIEQLLDITRTPYPARVGLIKKLSNQGYTVDHTPTGYRARSGSAEYVLPRIICPACHKIRGFVSFLSMYDVEHPWCVECRHANYEGAERARAERDAIWARGETPIRANMRCANAACPHGGYIPVRKLQQHYRFCSTGCRQALLAPLRQCLTCEQMIPRGSNVQRCPSCLAAARAEHTPRPCANPDCPENVTPPQKYCSLSCAVTYRQAVGFYKAISEKGNERNHDIKLATGKMPNYEERARRISEHNHTEPPRATAGCSNIEPSFISSLLPPLFRPLSLRD